MSARIKVADEFRDAVEKYVADGGPGVEVVGDGEADLTVESSAERRECTGATLYSGGWIACSTALSIACRLNLGPREVGRLMDALEVKIKKCSLGCFG